MNIYYHNWFTTTTSGFLMELAFMIPTTDVVNGTCTDWDIFPSKRAQRIFGIASFIIEYLLPATILVVSV